jgi:tetratricopeptide (TPR) repeat protein
MLALASVSRYIGLSVVAVALLAGQGTTPWDTPAHAKPTPQVMQWYSQGVASYNQNNLPNAISLFEQAVKADPTFTDGWYNLGSVQYRADQYAKARAAYQQVLVLNPADHQARLNMAQAMEFLGEQPQAVAAYQAIPNSHPAYAKAQERLAALNKGQAPAQPVATNPKPTPPATTPNTGSKQVESFATQLFGPTGMALGPAGEVYIANFSKNNIIKVMPDGRRSTLVEGSGLSGPIGLVRDPRTGDLLVANYLSGQVLRVNSNGVTNVVAKDLKKPYNLLLDSLGNTLYVSEQESNSVSRIKL